MNLILDESIRDLKARTNLADVVSSKVKLKGSGDDLIGLCPFHAEKTPSFHVHPERGFFKCFGCGKSGDAIAFVQETDGLSFNAAAEALASRFNCVLNYSSNGDSKKPIPTRAPSDTWRAIQSEMRPGTEDELHILAELRGIPSIAGLLQATAANQLFFADIWDDGGDRPAWLITDSSRRNAQARRMDGQPWTGIGGKKAKTIKGCEASWPIGAADLNGMDFALVEGGPDFLAAWHAIATTKADNIRPIGMLGASNDIHPEAIPLLKNKRAWIFPHTDEAGLKAGKKWAEQLGGGDQFDFAPHKVKDLNDLVVAGPLPPLFAPSTIEMDFGSGEEPAKATDLIARPLFDFQIPPPGDPSVLLGNRYLSRGDLLILASTSGMGKSSLSLQAATTWALKRPLFGALQPHLPIRSLFFQSEDNEGDIAEVRHSLAHAMKLTPEEQSHVGNHVKIVTDRIHRGLSFRQEVKRQLALFPADIVWVNPLLAFIGGDVNDAEAVGQFIREQLNSLNEPPTHAYAIVHHTAKPPKERTDRRWNEVMYDMAGSADLTNAARAILSLRPSDTEGQFNLVLAKRGVRAGYTKKVKGVINPGLTFDEPTTIIGLKHSRDRMLVDGRDLPVIHWEQSEVTTDQPKNQGGRPAKYQIEDFLTHFPKLDEPALPSAQIWKRVEGVSGIKLSTFKDLVMRAAKAGLVNEVTLSSGSTGYRRLDHSSGG